MYLSRGRETNALEILRPIHDWFTEGFNCLELKAARDILKDIDSASKSPSDFKRQSPSLACKFDSLYCITVLPWNIVPSVE